MKLIDKDDPRYFTQTSDALYDRHWYKVHCTDKSVSKATILERGPRSMVEFQTFYFSR